MYIHSNFHQEGRINLSNSFFSFNRYRTVWRFKDHTNFCTRIYVEKWEAESKEARSEMSTKGIDSPVAKFFSVLYRLTHRHDMALLTWILLTWQNLFPDSQESKINLFLFLSIKNVCLRWQRIYWGLFRGSFQILNSGRWKCGKNRQTWSFIKRPKRMLRKMFYK